MAKTPEPVRWRARMISPEIDGDRVMLSDEALAALVGQQFDVGRVIGATRDDEGWVVLEVESPRPPTTRDPNLDFGIAIGARIDAPREAVTAEIVAKPAQRLINSLDVFEVSLVSHPPHPGSVVLSPENPVCTCGVGYIETRSTP